MPERPLVSLRRATSCGHGASRPVELAGGGRGLGDQRPILFGGTLLDMAVQDLPPVGGFGHAPEVGPDRRPVGLGHPRGQAVLDHGERKQMDDACIEAR